MEIACPKCGALNWLENEKQCHLCQAVLRRCIDCHNFDRSRLRCKPLNYDMTAREAEQPSLLSTSTSCRFYIHGASARPAPPA